MGITRVDTEEFLALSAAHPVLDVRSPGEFAHAHIPGAHNLALFSDEERKTVGTAYKQESREKAIKLGLDFFGTRMVKMVEEVETIVTTGNQRGTVMVHCWRGGMRSAGVAWLLDLYGFRVYTLAGGYKSYRRWVLQQFEKDYLVNVIGGYTGSGKTEVLHALTKKKCHVIDLEKLACHKGSAFGNLGQPPQPSQEMFENMLADTLHRIAGARNETGQPAPVWVEDESQRIGSVNIPGAFFRQIRSSPIFFLNIPFEERLQYIVQHYGGFEKEKLVNAIIRIKKRLGGLETKTAVNHLLEDNVRECFSVLLAYYDKFYLKTLQDRDNFSSLFHELKLASVLPEENAAAVLDLEKKTFSRRSIA